ncbi:MAG: phosphotransferase-like protein [Oryzihumus sp.]
MSQAPPGATPSSNPLDRSDPRVPAVTRQGTVILLNGTSSSGKSSIAAELLEILDDTWFHLPVDAVHAMRSQREISDEDLPAELVRTSMGFHRPSPAWLPRATTSSSTTC